MEDHLTPSSSLTLEQQEVVEEDKREEENVDLRVRLYMFEPLATAEN